MISKADTQIVAENRANFILLILMPHEFLFVDCFYGNLLRLHGERLVRMSDCFSGCSGTTETETSTMRLL